MQKRGVFKKDSGEKNIFMKRFKELCDEKMIRSSSALMWEVNYGYTCHHC